MVASKPDQTAPPSTRDEERVTAPGPVRRWELIFIASLLLLQIAALTWQAWTLGLSFDEPWHLYASAKYWQGQDNTRPATVAPVAHIISGWIPSALGVEMHDPPGEAASWAGEGADKTFFPLGREGVRRTFFWARTPFFAFPLLITALVWWWGRLLFDPRIAGFLSAAIAFEPNILAHGPLINSDVAAAFGLLWVAFAAWRFWRRPTLFALLHFAVSLAFAIETKFSLLAFCPLAAALVVLRYALDRRWRWAAAAAPVLAIVSYVGLLASYQFHAGKPAGQMVQRELFEKDFFQDADRDFLLKYVRIPLPPQWLSGLNFLRNQGLEWGQPGYIAGRRIDPPEPFYFPLAMGVKFPIALQLLVLGGLLATVGALARKGFTPAHVFVWVPAFLIFAMAMPSHMLPGIRYIFPAFPLLILGAGFALKPLDGNPWGRAAAGCLLLWLAIASVRIYPQGLAYFNEFAGGPDNGWKYLADSNIDWGQNLPELQRYADQHNFEHAGMAYFGLGFPEHFARPGQFDVVPTPFCEVCDVPTVYKPKPGTYAISVNMLLGFFWTPEYENYFQYFREREPVAKAGYSIFIYEVKEGDAPVTNP